MPQLTIDEAKLEAERILVRDVGQFAADLSETDTRCKLIDSLLLTSLGWHERSIEREPKVSGENGYIDYVLHGARPAFVIEAKRRSLVFKLPSTKKTRQFRVGGVLSEDKALKQAITQCRDYGVSRGVSFCCVTNGLQYIFFRSHSDLGLAFEDHHAIVFDGGSDLIANFSLFHSLLSCEAVAEGRHYSTLPVAPTKDNRAKFHLLEHDPGKQRHKTRNRLEPFIRDVVREVFQDLSSESADPELIQQCYVESSSQGSYEQSLRVLVKNKPGLSEAAPLHPVRVARRSAGEFDSILESSDPKRKSGHEVVMLLGGIGSGKTTFLHRFRRVIARERIADRCIWINVDFNKFSDSPATLDRWVSTKIVEEAERSEPELDFGSYSHLRQAYHGEYERLRKGRLAPVFARDPQEFEALFAVELEKFESDYVGHVAKLLRSAQKVSGRRVFLVFDNADQYPASVQNSVFMLAHRLASEVGCSLIVSLREESFWKNKDFGALSAFHGVNFYIEAPDLKQVVAKRFAYATDLLAHRTDYVVPSGGLGVTEEQGLEIFKAIRATILDDKQFIQFLEALSPGEIRRPLDQLSRFMFSGHTNVDSIAKAVKAGRSLKIGFHEFVKSVALGDRGTFNEELSDLVNLFASVGAEDASNLNRLAILGYIHRFRRDKSEKGLGFVPFGSVVDACTRFGLSADTVQAVIHFANARRLLETDQQVREEVSPSFYVKTTAAFDYYIEHLGRHFAYVDLVIPGTLIPQGDDADMIERISRQIYSAGNSADERIERLRLRIDRARQFASFIKREADAHGMFRAEQVHEAVIKFVTELDSSLERQSAAIIASAASAFHRKA